MLAMMMIRGVINARGKRQRLWENLQIDEWKMIFLWSEVENFIMRKWKPIFSITLLFASVKTAKFISLEKGKLNYLHIVTVRKAHPLILKRHKICFNISRRSACAVAMSKTKSRLEIKRTISRRRKRWKYEMLHLIISFSLGVLWEEVEGRKLNTRKMLSQQERGLKRNLVG